MIKKLNAFIDWILTKLKLIKYREQIIYLFVGGGTTVVDWVVYALFVLFVPPVSNEFLNKISPNFISYCVAWFSAVLFAYFMSKLFVFEETGENVVVQFVKFFFSRFMTLVISILGDVFLCGEYAIIKMNPFVVKLIISVLVVIINYITSKLFVFKKRKDISDGQN